MSSKGRLVSAVTLSLLLVISTAAAQDVTPAQQPDAHDVASRRELDAIDAYIRAAMKSWDVAGLSVAIVKEGRVLFVRGYGVRDVSTGAPVDGDTIFPIGSMTKSVTAVMAGLAVDRGKLSFDDLLTARLDHFAVGDPYVTGAATIRDALSHRTGFDWSSDALLLSSRSRRELIERLARLRPPHPFRQDYHYANVVYIAGSEAVAAAQSQSWETLAAEAVFKPLRMTRTTTSAADAEKLGDVAKPHRNLGSGPRPIESRDISIAGGAGAIAASAADMARFVTMMSESGKLGGAPFLKPATFAEILTPNINVGVESYLRPFSNFHAYGIGWELIDYKGRLVAFHGGAIDGMLSHMAVVPRERLGVVVLTNTDGTRYLPDAIALTILDHFLGGTMSDWTGPLLKRGLAMRQVLYGTPERVADTAATVPLSSFVGLYTAPLGTIEVRRDGDALAFQYGALHGKLEHWHYDTFRGNFGMYADRLVTFSFDNNRIPSRLNVEFIGDFVRAPE